MPDDSNLTPQNGTEPPRKTLREIVEQTYDDLVDGADGETPSEAGEGDGQSSRPRDNLGRFVAADQTAEPGEADGVKPPSQPRQDEISAPPEPPHPAPEGSSREAPAHWPAHDRDMYAKAPPEMQAWALRREAAVEADYQRKVQGIATAASFVNAIRPAFQDPRVAGSLQKEGLTPVDAVNQWAGFHVRFMDPDPRVRANVMQELMQRSGLDPAAVFQLSPPGIPGLSPQEQNEPAIRYIADHIGRTSQQVQGLVQDVARMQAQAQANADAADFARARWAIEEFAEARDQQGNPLHPDFNTVIPIIYDLIAANPQRPMQEAYDYAIGAHPETRKRLIAAELQRQQREQSNIRARQAIKSNARGLTTPVAGEAPQGPLGLRATIEAAAEELGF